MNDKDKQRFYVKVQVIDDETSCWLWRGWTHKRTGYGTFSIDGRRDMVHRQSWRLHFGEIPPGMFVGHKCDVRACVRPDHLSLMTPLENQIDRTNKGRAGFFRRDIPNEPRAPKLTKEEIFWRWVRKDESGCWVWTRSLDSMGYGRFWYGSEYLAHRVSFLLTNGYIDPDLDILHSCDNPSCVNPDHLSLGTAKDNMRDMIKKGRRKPMLGMGHHQAKLTDQQVIHIRQLYAVGNVSYKELANMFDVSDSLIGYIVKRKGWKHIP